MQVSEYNNIDPYSQKVTIINLSGFAYWIGSSLIGYGLKTTTTPTKFRSFELPQSKKKKKKGHGNKRTVKPEIGFLPVFC